MLIVRADQIAALNGKIEQGFRLSVKQYLRDEMPEAIHGQSDEKVLDRITEIEHNAAVLGIEEPVPLVQYICLAIAMGAEFESDPDVRAYLSRTDIDQETRLESLIDELEDA